MAGMNQLSERQHQVLALLADGHTDAELAAALHISIATVHRHIEDLRHRLGGARNRAHAVALGYRVGLLAPGGRVTQPKGAIY